MTVNYTATYSPDDNKIRLYASARLEPDIYARVKAAGFIWAPKQDLFVAPMWTPEREDLATELAGQIDDEDSTLADRAEVRAERFADYSEKRRDEAEAAKDAVAAICDGIPLGQPILVGHHSEKRARRDAEKIRSGTDKAVRLWETANYWKARAAGALRHAKYKELPAVRHRRIKGLESDKRKHLANIADSEKFTKLWQRDGLTLQQAKAIANYDRAGSFLSFPLADYPRNPPASQYEGNMGLWSALDGGIIDEAKARALALPIHAQCIESARRWIAHIDNRLEYERAMLGDDDATEKFANIQTGGRVLCGREWLTVLRVNRSGATVNSVSVAPPAGGRSSRPMKVAIESVSDYRAPEGDDMAKAKAATKLAPLCNFPQDGGIEMAKADYDRRARAQMACVRTVAATAERGAYRQRFGLAGGGSYKMVPVFITDAKRVDPPAPVPPTEPTDAAEFVREFVTGPSTVPHDAPAASHASEDSDFRAMRDGLKSGTTVKVVTASQLFPTPDDLARRMVKLCGVMPGERVLEPSAGTAAIIRQIVSAFTQADCGRMVAIELNRDLAEGLREYRNKLVYSNESNFKIVCADFLTIAGPDSHIGRIDVSAPIGTFHRIVMNPPFANGADIQHIEHAARFLKPGGRLVAICADGPRQQERLRPQASHWEALPAGSFKSEGTNVNAALLVIDAAP